MTSIVRALVASAMLMLAGSAGWAAEVPDPVAGPNPPPQAGMIPAAPRVGADATPAHTARKWRSKRKDRTKKAATGAPATAPAPFIAAGIGETMPGHIHPLVAAAAVCMPAGCVAALAAGTGTGGRSDDLALTAERIRRSWLVASAMGPPAMGVAIASLSAVHGAPPAPVPTAAPPASVPPAPPTTGVSIWDTHLPDVAVPGAVAPNPYGRLRVFGHLAIDHWEGDKNVGLRAGPKGTTEVYDAAVGVESRLSEDTEVRIRALTILIPLANNGDGAAAGDPSNTFKDYLYMRDVYLGVLHLFQQDWLNTRIGRVPVAFGDEYLQYDAPDNPLVSHSVAFFSGYNGGLQLYGDITKEFSYIANVYGDDHLGNGSDAFASKAWGAKLMYDHDHFHASASYYDGGVTGVAQQLGMFYFGRELAAPVGATGAPGGASKSTQVSTDYSEADLRYSFKEGYVSGAAGLFHLTDDGVHDREFHWLKIEPYYRFSPRWNFVGRYSKIYVDNPQLGFRFNSFETIGTDLNFDVHERERTSLGVGYKVNQYMSMILEHSFDRWGLISTPLKATIAADPNNRDYSVFSVVAKF